MIAESKEGGERIQEGASLQLRSENKKEIYSKNLSLTPLPPNRVRIHQQTWHRQFYRTSQLPNCWSDFRALTLWH